MQVLRDKAAGHGADAHLVRAGLVDHHLFDNERLAGFDQDRGFGHTIVSKYPPPASERRSEEHTSELQSLMRISYAVFCLKKQKSNLSHVNTILNQNTIL